MTPLRYPGGKQRLAPFINEIIKFNSISGCEYIEPYAGGAGVAIDLLLKKAVSRVHLNDSSYQIFAFWSSMLGDPDAFCKKILTSSLTVEEWKRQRHILQNPKEHELAEVGFSAFYLNRCNRSGVLSGGLIGGLAQQGIWKMDARFPRNELIRRVESIALFSDKVDLSNKDAEVFLDGLVPTKGLTPLVYCDPPYFLKSSGLYLDNYKAKDHQRIASFLKEKMRHKWLVSYDAASEILDLYRDRKHFVYDLQYSAAKSYKGKEVFVFSDNLEIPRSSKLPFVDCVLALDRKDEPGSCSSGPVHAS